MSRTLIVNADDLGYDPAIDRGILFCFDHGLVSSTTLMVNTPFAAAAAEAARARDALGVGLHVNLARGTPLSSAESLVGDDGHFAPSRLDRADRDDLRRELVAQLDRFQVLMGRPPTHIDVHKHLHRMPAVLDAILHLAPQRALPVRSIDPAMRARLRGAGIPTPDDFVGDTGPQPFWSPSRLLVTIHALPEGTTELMCHPGYAPEQVLTGYGPQREGELRALTAPEVLEAARRLGLSKTTFAALDPGG